MPYVKNHLGQLPTSAETALKPGQPILIEFWASWCPLCLASLEDLAHWQQDPAFANVNLLSVASPGFLNEQPTPDFRDWYAGVKTAKPVVHIDDGGQLAQALNIQVYPSWALIDPQGQVQQVIKGALTRPQVLALIDAPQIQQKSEQLAYYQAQKGEKTAQPMHKKTIYFAGGCFWGGGLL